MIHQANILVHVVAGAIALICGVVALVAYKGQNTHRKSGKIFLYSFLILIGSALIGVFFFRSALFLLVITMQSFFQLAMGYMAFKRKSKGPAALEGGITALVLFSAAMYIWYINRTQQIWSPVVIYSTIGYMLFLATYKYASFFFPRIWHRKLWLYEHIVNMIGAWSAALAAFSGTVLKQWHPYSQVLPSVLGFILIIGFVAYYLSNKQKEMAFVTNV